MSRVQEAVGPPPKTSRSQGGRRGPLRDRRFRRFWASHALTVVAEQMFLVLLTALLVDRRGASTSVGVVLACGSLPMAAMLPLGGRLADRVDPGRLLAYGHATQGLLLAAAAALIAADVTGVGVLAALAAATGTVAGLTAPAHLAAVPRLVGVEQRPAANALTQGAETLGDLVGPALAAALFAISAEVGFGTIAAMALVSAALTFGLIGRIPIAVGGSGPQSGVGGSYRELLAHRRLRGLIVVLGILSLTIAGPVVVGAAVLAEQRFGGVDRLGIVLAGFGGGALAGLAVITVTGMPRRAGPATGAAVAVLGLALAALGQAQTLLAAVALTTLIGAVGALLQVALVTWAQNAVPDAVRGRAMGLIALSVVALDPASFLLAGLLLPAGVDVLFAVCGGMLVLVAVPLGRRFAG